VSEMTPKEMAEKCKILYKQVDELLSELQDDADAHACAIIETLDDAGIKIKEAEQIQELQQTIRDLVMIVSFKVITFAMMAEENKNTTIN